MPAEQTTTAVDATLARFTTIGPADHKARTDVVTDWKQLVGDDPDALRVLYEHYFATVHRLLGHTDAAGGLDGVAGHVFVCTFASGRYLDRARPLAWQLLMAGDAEHRAMLAEAMARPDEVVTEQHLRTESGRWGDIPTSMLELYYWHAPFGAETDAVQADITHLLPDLFSTFPEQDSRVLVGLLGEHPDLVEVAARIIGHHLQLDQARGEGLLKVLALDMLGRHARRSDPLHRHATDILASVLDGIDAWPDETVTRFVRRFVDYPLGLLPKASDDTDEVADKRRRAVQQVAVSAANRKALTLINKRLPKAHREPVTALLNEAADHRNRPKVFPIAGPKENRFADLGLKLLVIEELMYRQGVLEPKFDVREFAREYDKREISVEDDGYKPIPEVQRYFKHLPIADDLLAKVERLHQSSGLDGGAEFMRQLHPFWDPGMGDEAIKVTNKAAQDLALLPNLTLISGLENSRPSKKLLTALADHGIKLVDEESA
ncbi:DUF6892 domain-containing protein [Microlunatus sp. Y2014]|uniref:DUF6892 domain-containing protein n=1 Tax=Microlunatus sp. Y2014 TaxID=3418488 RepID=UPI003DA798CA